MSEEESFSKIEKFGIQVLNLNLLSLVNVNLFLEMDLLLAIRCLRCRSQELGPWIPKERFMGVSDSQRRKVEQVKSSKLK